MTNEEVIRKLEFLQEFLYVREMCSEGERDAILHAIEVLRADTWMPIDDNLPKDKWIVVTNTLNKYANTAVLYNDEMGQWLDSNDFSQDIDYFTKWKPLNPPQKGE